MKTVRYILPVIIGVFLLFSCNDDKVPTGPSLASHTESSTAMFGDSLEFAANAAEGSIALSTLKAQLFYGEEKVSETVIRTKTNGEYAGKIFVPYMANIPNGKATLKLVLQDINQAITEIESEIALTRPDFPYLTLVSEETDDDGNNIEYRMERTGLYQYSATGRFPQKVKSYIKSPKMGENGNEIVFGWESGAIKEGTTTSISFSNSSAGEYTIFFNTLTYEADPFVKLLINEKEMEMVDDDNYQINLNLTNGQEITMSGFPDMEEWWLDTDFFKKENDIITFLPISGSYRITANYTYKYFIVEVLKDGEPATLQNDGTGAVWVIGEKIGKPSLSNAVGWTTEKALCMAPVANGKYQITVVGGKSIGTTSINFKFFHQKGWGDEFGAGTFTCNSDIVFIGDGTNGRDPGNLGVNDGKSFTEGSAYVFTLDLSAGNTNGVLTITEI